MHYAHCTLCSQRNSDQHLATKEPTRDKEGSHYSCCATFPCNHKHHADNQPGVRLAVMVVLMFSTTDRNIYTLSSKFLYAQLCHDSSPVPIPKKQTLSEPGWYRAPCQITSQSVASQVGTKLPPTTRTEELSTTTSLYTCTAVLKVHNSLPTCVHCTYRTFLLHLCGC